MGAVWRQVAGGDLEGGHPPPHHVPHHPCAGQHVEPAEPGGSAAAGTADPRRGPIPRGAGAPLPRGTVLSLRGPAPRASPWPRCGQRDRYQSPVYIAFVWIVFCCCTLWPARAAPGPPPHGGRPAGPRPRPGVGPPGRYHAWGPSSTSTFFLSHWATSLVQKSTQEVSFQMNLLSCLYNKAPSDSCYFFSFPPFPFSDGLCMLCGVALVCAQGILNPKHSQVSVYSDKGCVKNGGSGLVAVLDGAKTF